MRTNHFVISLGGSVAFPVGGLNINFLKEFCFLIKSEIRKGRKFIIIVGGGALCRAYQNGAERINKISASERDWIGIYSTWLNARLLMTALKEVSHPVLLNSQGRVSGFGKYKVIIGAGWKPGHSTDFIAVQSALDFKAQEVINLGKPAYVYSANPDKDETAKPIKALSWNDYLRIIPKQWAPGLNTPFDPVASRLAKKHNLKVIVAAGQDLKNFQKILRGKKFEGTIITNDKTLKIQKS